MKTKDFFTSPGFKLIVSFIVAVLVLLIFNKQIEAFTGIKLFMVPLMLALLFSGIFIYVTYEQQIKVILKNFLFIVGVLIFGVLLIFGVGKVYSAFHPWSVEKKQAYAFTCLMREFYKHPEKMGKVTFYAEKDCKEIQVNDVKTLENWSSYNFLNIELPEGSFDGGSIFISYAKRNDETMHFFSKVTYQRGSGFWTSVPYSLTQGLSNDASDEAVDKSNLEAIGVVKNIVSEM